MQKCENQILYATFSKKETIFPCTVIILGGS